MCDSGSGPLWSRGKGQGHFASPRPPGPILAGDSQTQFRDTPLSELAGPQVNPSQVMKRREGIVKSVGAAPRAPLEPPITLFQDIRPRVLTQPMTASPGPSLSLFSLTGSSSPPLLSPPRPSLLWLFPSQCGPQRHQRWQQVISTWGLSEAWPCRLHEELEGHSGTGPEWDLSQNPRSSIFPGSRVAEGACPGRPRGWSGWEAWLETKGTGSQDPPERPPSPVPLSSASLPLGHCPPCGA